MKNSTESASLQWFILDWRNDGVIPMSFNPLYTKIMGCTSTEWKLKHFVVFLESISFRGLHFVFRIVIVNKWFVYDSF